MLTFVWNINTISYMNRKQLIEIIRKRKSFLCVGLDTDLKKLPACLASDHDAMFTFNKNIIDATAPYCAAYKPNAAFYEAAGVVGESTLKRTVEYLKENYPDHFVLLDAKRGDIGNTARMYARAAFEELGADAVTVAPYMGSDSVTPFLEYKDKFVVLLALTSNAGSADFQMTEDANGERLFEKVLRTSLDWGNPENLMYVVGATRGSLIGDVRKIVPDSFLLVPGVGAQGGSLEEVCKYGMTDDCGLLVNSSRGIIYADSTENYAQVAGEKAKELAAQMAKILDGYKK